MSASTMAMVAAVRGDPGATAYRSGFARPSAADRPSIECRWASRFAGDFPASVACSIPATASAPCSARSAKGYRLTLEVVHEFGGEGVAEMRCGHALALTADQWSLLKIVATRVRSLSNVPLEPVSP